MDENELIIRFEDESSFFGDEFSGSYHSLMVNGEKIKANGDPLKAVLEHLGYNVDIYYG